MDQGQFSGTTEGPSAKAKASPVDLGARRRRQQIVSRLESLPPLPAAAQEVLSIVAGDPKDLVHLEQAIRHDPSLAAQLLKVANSAAYAPRKTIDTVRRAVVFLGFSEVRNIALGLSIYKAFKELEDTPHAGREELWTHAIATGIVARLLAFETGEEDAEVFFTAGLLHDLGRIALAAYFPKEWADIVRSALWEESPLLVAEHNVGLPHSMIGAWLAKSWGLPKVYVATIGTHHLPPSHAKATRTGSLIQLADEMCHANGMGVLHPPPSRRQALISSLEIDPELVEYLEDQLEAMEGVTETIAEMSRSMG